MVKDVCVVTDFVIIKFVSNLAMNRVIGEVIATPRDYWVAAIVVVARLSDIQHRVAFALGDDDVNGELALDTFSMKSELV